MRWPNFKFFWGREQQLINSTICVWTRVRTPLFSSSTNSLLLSSWATWDNRKVVWKDAESIFRRSFHGRPCCRIIRSLMVMLNRTVDITQPFLSPVCIWKLWSLFPSVQVKLLWKLLMRRTTWTTWSMRQRLSLCMLLKVDVELSLPFRALLDDDDDISFCCLW